MFVITVRAMFMFMCLSFMVFSFLILIIFSLLIISALIISHSSHASHSWHSSHHSAHSTHSTHSAHWVSSLSFLFFLFYDHAFGGSHVRTYWRSVFKSNSDNFCWINNSSGNQINKLTFAGIKSKTEIGTGINLLDSCNSFESSIIRNGLARQSYSFFDDLDA